MLDVVAKEELKSKKGKRIPKERICCKCGNTETRINSSGNPEWLKYRGDGMELEWDGKSYLCNKCDKDIRNNLKNSYKNDIKKMAQSRIGTLSRYNEQGKSVISQWISAKTLSLKDLNIENDNFSEYIDLSSHRIYGRADIKSSSLSDGRWIFHRMYKKCDTYIFLCMDINEPWKDVKRIYTVPCEYIFGETSVSIFENWKDSSRLRKWEFLEKYRVDERPFNDTYHSVDIPEFFSPFDLWNGKYDVK